MQALNGQAAAVQKLVEIVSNHTYSFFTAIAAVGILSMAVIQTVKDMLPIRRWFQQAVVASWLKDKATQARTKLGEWIKTEDASKWMEQESVLVGSPLDLAKLFNSVNEEIAEKDLIRLATDGDGKAFYDLPIEQLCGQLNAAAQVVLDDPIAHRSLMLCLACRSEPRDIVRLWLPPMEITEARPKEGLGRQRFDSFVDARNRVNHQVQRAIDALQVSAGFRWKFYLQLASISLSAVIAGLGVFLLGDVQGLCRRLLTTIAVAILGGFLAPVARDLVAALQQLRK